MATKPKNTAAAAAGPATKGLRVVARSASFRRAGREFTAEPTVVPLDELTVEQAEQISTDPMLVATEVDIEQPKAGA